MAGEQQTIGGKSYEVIKDAQFKDEQYLAEKLSEEYECVRKETFEELKANLIHSYVAEKLGLKHYCEANDLVVIPTDDLLPAHPMDFDRFITKMANQLYTFTGKPPDTIPESKNAKPRIIPCGITIPDLKYKLSHAKLAVEARGILAKQGLSSMESHKQVAIDAQKNVERLLEESKNGYKEREELIEKWQLAIDKAATEQDSMMRGEIMTQASEMESLVSMHKVFHGICGAVLKSQLRTQHNTLLQYTTPMERLLMELRKPAGYSSLPQVPRAAIGVDFAFIGWEEEKEGQKPTKDLVVSDTRGHSENAFDSERGNIDEQIQFIDQQIKDAEKELAKTKDRHDAEQIELKISNLHNERDQADERLDTLFQSQLERSKAVRKDKMIRNKLKADKEHVNDLMKAKKSMRPVWQCTQEVREAGGVFQRYSDYMTHSEASKEESTGTKQSSGSGDANVTFKILPLAVNASGNKQKQQSDGSRKEDAKSKTIFQSTEATILKVDNPDWTNVMAFMNDHNWSLDGLYKFDITKPPHIRSDLGETARRGLNTRLAVSGIVVTQKTALFFEDSQMCQKITSQMKSQSDSFKVELGLHWGGKTSNASVADSKDSATNDQSGSASKGQSKNTIEEGNMRVKFILLERVPMAPCMDDPKLPSQPPPP